MTVFRRCQITMALVSCVGFVIPSSVAFGATPSMSRVQDVSIGVGGALEGKVIDSSGHAVAGAKVRVRQASEVVAEADTDADGSFVFEGLRGGVCQIETPGASRLFRLWAAKIAPPHAVETVLMVAKSEIVRGQCCTDATTSCTTSCGSTCEGSCTTSCNDCSGGCGGNVWPLVLGAGVAAAIALPLALDDDDDNSAS